jgi:hypothetical protein
MKTTLTPELIKMYHKCRKQKPFMMTGRDAECSLSAAKTILRFRQLESIGLVRMRCEVEEESYHDVFGDLGPGERNGHPMSEADTRKKLNELLERYGCWWTVAEWRQDEDSEWEQANSCGMHTGYKNPLDPFENCYVVQEMQSAIDAIESFRQEKEQESQEANRCACGDIETINA